MSKHHSFNTRIAKDIGIVPAIILNNLDYWLEKNIANNKHYYDGSYWTYNSVRAFSDLFPYMSANTIRNALNKLEELELIKTGNYNKVGYDKTKWYTITDYGKCILQNKQIDLPKVTNGTAKSNKPIPDINTDINTNVNIKTIVEKKELDDIPYNEIIDYLNKVLGSRYRNTSNNQTVIRARWNDGFRLEDFKKVIDIKYNDWKDNEYSKFLRPATLFGTKFESYLNQPVAKKELSIEERNKLRYGES